MSWIGLGHKGVEPLYPDEWNRVVDALDILYGYVGDLDSRKLDRIELLYLKSDIIPYYGGRWKLGDDGREWLAIYGVYGYFKSEVYVQGKRVIKDGDPIRIVAFIESAKADVEKLYSVMLDIRDYMRSTLSSTGTDSWRVEIALDKAGLAKESTQAAIKQDTANLDVPLSELRAKIEEVYGVVRELNDKIQRKILQFLDGALGVDTRFAQRIELGYAFSASHRFENVSSGDIVESWFENPPGSGREVNIIAIEVSGLGAGWVDIYRNNTKIASGTRIPALNLNMGSKITPVAIPEYGGQYTPGTLAHQTVLPGGIKINAIGSMAEVGERLKIPPGYNILVRITNKAATTTDYSIRYLWWEDLLS